MEKYSIEIWSNRFIWFHEFFFWIYVLFYIFWYLVTFLTLFYLQVQRQDLASSSLDVQDLTLGKYIIKWIREDEASANKNEADHDTEEELLAVSTYELQSVRVCQSSLYAEAYLPAFATARIPFGLEYVLKNKTDVMLEFNLAMEPSEAFMLSGNKQQHFKIPPGASYKLNFVLYPLLAGEAVALPVPKLSSLRPVLPHDDVGATLQRLLPSTITGIVLIPMFSLLYFLLTYFFAKQVNKMMKSYT